MIPLHQPWFDHREEEAAIRVLRSRELAGNGRECRALEEELQAKLKAEHVFVVSSGSHALELAMEISDVRGGEVILPSFTFPSVGNAILRAGGKPVFCEVREADLNIDLNHARNLITPHTKAIVATHYAGHPVDFEDILIPVIEDAAHALGSTLRHLACGTIGSVGCLSFDQMKHVTAGEGGALLCKLPDLSRRAALFREKGTNRDDFKAGRVKFYTWMSLGSSYVLPELSAAIARVQLAKLEESVSEHRRIASHYDQELEELERSGLLKIVRPVAGESNYHIYAVLVDPSRRASILSKMNAAGVGAAFHYLPLHSSPYGLNRAGPMNLPMTDRLAASVVRLPIYPGLTETDLEKVIDTLEAAVLY